MSKKLYSLYFCACMLVFFGVVITITNILNTKDPVSPSKSIASVIYPDNINTSYVPQISAKSAVLIDGLSGAVLYEKNSSEKLPMASTTKIMTAKVILDNTDPETVVSVPKEATLVEGSSIYLHENEKIKIETLLYGLMLESGNDAAHTLAVACSGSIERFAELMNETGKQMGLTSSSFSNPHGLSDENHYTTAYELAYITYHAMQNPAFRKLVSTKNMVVQSLDGDFTRYFSNHNKLLRIYDGAIGVKTGYTKAAGRCLVSAAEKDGKMFIAVTLNDGNDWNDHINMLNFAFENYDTVKIAPKEEFRIYNNNGFALVNEQDICLTVPKGNKPILSYSVNINNNTGKVQYFADGLKIGEFDLIQKNPSQAISD